MVHYRNSLKSPILRWTAIPSSYTRVKERPFRKKIIALCLNSERSRGGVEWQISLNELASKGRNVYRDVYRKLAPKSFTRIKSNRSNLVERRKLRSSNDQPLLAPGSSRVFHERRARKKVCPVSLSLSLFLSPLDGCIPLQALHRHHRIPYPGPFAAIRASSRKAGAHLVSLLAGLRATNYRTGGIIEFERYPSSTSYRQRTIISYHIASKEIFAGETRTDREKYKSRKFLRHAVYSIDVRHRSQSLWYYANAKYRGEWFHLLSQYI